MRFLAHCSSAGPGPEPEGIGVIDPDLLAIVRCPVTGGPLHFAVTELVAEVNERIRRGEVRDRLDQTVRQPIEGGLVSSGAGLVYPIRGGIPGLVADEAICWNPNAADD